MSNNRVMIDAAAGIFEVEGEAGFVETQLDKLLPLVTSGGFVKADAGRTLKAAEEGTPDTTGKTNSSKKAKRGTGSRPPKGHSCADRLKALRDDGFFKEQKTPSQMVEGLAEKGWTHTSNQVSAAAGQMFNRGDIQRTKSGNGFAYFWDRE